MRLLRLACATFLALGAAFGCTSSSSSRSYPPGGCVDAYGFARIPVDVGDAQDAFELCSLCSDAGAVAYGCPSSLGCGFDRDAGEFVCSYGPPPD
jgi:hypothetical protein